MGIEFCKGCKVILESISSHGEKKFWEFPYNPYKLSFLRVNSVGYDDYLVGFSGNLSHYHPRKLNSRSNRRWLEK